MLLHLIFNHHAVAATLFAVLGLAVSEWVRGEEVVENYPLYYRLGGGRVTDIAAADVDLLPSSAAVSATATTSACGGFNRSGDVLGMLSERLEDSLTGLNSVPAVITSALPGTVLCRAKPSLCQLLQHYVVRAENHWNLSVDECRRDVETNSRGHSPQHQVLKAARVQVWQEQAATGASVAEARRKANTTDGCIAWVGGQKAGCQGSAPIWLLREGAQVGWCMLMEQSAGCTGAPLAKAGDERHGSLGRVWPTPQAAGQWVVNVLGDYRIQAGKATETIAGAGLLPEIDRLTDTLAQVLHAKVYQTTFQGDRAKLQLEGANLVLAAPVIDALRDLPDRDFLIVRLANEAALAEVIEQAFLARRVLLSGLMELHIQSAGAIAQTSLQHVTGLEQEIARASWEMQARRRVVSATVLEILGAHRVLTTPAEARHPSAALRLP